MRSWAALYIGAALLFIYINPVYAIAAIIAVSFLLLLIVKSELKWFLLILAIPLDNFSYYSGMSFKLWMLILLIAVTIWFLQLLVGKTKLSRNILNISLPLLVIANILSSVNAVNSDRSIRMLLQYLILYVLAYFAANNIRTEKRIKDIIRYMFITGGAVCLFGIAQFIGGIYGKNIKFPIENYSVYNPDMAMFLTVWWVDINHVIVPRIRGAFGDPTLFGGYVLSIFPLMLSMTVHRITAKKSYFAYLLLTGITIGAGLATFSRTITGGIAVACGVLAYYWIGKSLNTNILKLFVKIIIFAALAAALLPGSVSKYLNPALIINRLQQTMAAGDFSTKLHIDLAEAGVKMWSKHPFLGVGIGNYGSALVKGNSATTLSHSALLSFFAETGMIGGIINLFAVCSVMYYLVRTIRKIEKYSYWFAVNVGLLSSYAATVSGNITYHYYNQAYVWFLMGFSVAVAFYCRRSADSALIVGSKQPEINENSI